MHQQDDQQRPWATFKGAHRRPVTEADITEEDVARENTEDVHVPKTAA